MPGIQVIQDNSMDYTNDMFRAAGNLAGAVGDYKQNELKQEAMQKELQVRKEREEAKKVFAQRMEQSHKTFSNPNASLEDRMAAYQPILDYQAKTGEDMSKQYGVYGDDLKNRMEGKRQMDVEGAKAGFQAQQDDKKYAQQYALEDKKFANDKSLKIMEMNDKRETAKVEKALAATKDATKGSDTLRTEFSNSQVFKDTEKVNTGYKNAINALAKSTGPGDITSIFGYFKTIDPSSTVREGEFKSAAMSSGLVDRVNGWLTKTQNGKFLSDEARENFAEIMTDSYREQLNRYDKAKSGYEKIADKRGLDKTEIFTTDFEAPKSAKEALQTAKAEATKNQKPSFKYLSPADQKDLQARPEVQERVNKFAAANSDKLGSMTEAQRADVLRKLFEKIVNAQGYTIKTDNVAGN